MSNPDRLRSELEALFHSSLIGAAFVSHGHFVRVNEEFARIHGRRAAELAGAPAGEFAADPRHAPSPPRSSYQRAYVRPDGDRRLLQIEETLLDGDHAAAGRLIAVVDITDRQRHATELEKLAHHDPLTGLPNRRLLYDRLEQALARSRRAGELAAVLLVDLDGFKPVNDTHGHKAGDDVLRITADRLKGCLRSVDTVARFGGDEFVVVLDGLATGNDVAPVAAKIIEAVGRPISPPWSASPGLGIGCSIGVALYPRDATDPDLLIRLADDAMYRAKQAGRGRFMCHSVAV